MERARPTEPTGDLDSGRVGPRVDDACSLAANVARVHSQQLLQRSVTLEVELRAGP